jgi:hypothetical protein
VTRDQIDRVGPIRVQDHGGRMVGGARHSRSLSQLGQQHEQERGLGGRRRARDAPKARGTEREDRTRMLGETGATDREYTRRRTQVSKHVQ